MTPTPPELLLSLLAGAAAIGLSPYAALAATGLASYLGLVALPGTLSGLAAPVIWGSLLALTLLDAALSHYRLSDLVWNAFHTLVRPLAAVLYASAALAHTSEALQWVGALTALLLALLVHFSVLAVRTAARSAGPISRRSGFTALRLLAAAALATLAPAAPPYAAALAALLLLAPLPSFPRLWGAVSLALRAVLVALTRPDRLHRWDSGADKLPRRLRRALERELGEPIGPARSARVTLARLGPRWVYRPGRLVFSHLRPPLFVYRRALRPRVLRLQRGVGRPDHRALIETLEVEGRMPYAFCLDPAAPTGPAIMAELEGGAERGAGMELRPPAGV
jgi:hypothetical protein